MRKPEPTASPEPAAPTAARAFDSVVDAWVHQHLIAGRGLETNEVNRIRDAAEILKRRLAQE